MSRSAHSQNHTTPHAQDTALFIHQRYEDTAMVIFQQLSKKRGKDRGGKALPLGGGQAPLPYQLQVSGQPPQPQLSPGKTRALPNNSTSSTTLGQPPSSPASTSGSKPASPASRARYEDGQASGGVVAGAAAAAFYNNDSTSASATPIKQSDIILSHPLSNIDPADNTSYGGSLPVDSPMQSSTHSDMTNPTSDNTASVNSTVDSDSESDTAAKLDDTAETDDEKTHVSESQVKAVFIADTGGVIADGQVQPIQHEDLISPLGEEGHNNQGALTYDLGPISSEAAKLSFSEEKAADDAKNASSLSSKEVISAAEAKPTSSPPTAQDSNHRHQEEVRHRNPEDVKPTLPPKPKPKPKPTTQTTTIVSVSDVNTNLLEDLTTTSTTAITKEQQDVEKKNFVSEIKVFVSKTGINPTSPTDAKGRSFEKAGDVAAAESITGGVADNGRSAVRGSESSVTNADPSWETQKDSVRSPVYSTSSDPLAPQPPVVLSRSDPISVKDIAASTATKEFETSSTDSGSTLKNAEESSWTTSSASSARHSESSARHSESSARHSESSARRSESTVKNTESTRKTGTSSSASPETVAGATLKNTESSRTTSSVSSTVRYSEKESTRSTSSEKGGSTVGGSPLDRNRVSSSSSVFGASGAGVEFAHYGSSGVVARRKVAMSRSDKSQTQSKVCVVM